jgi:DNA polymerase III delta prime subunit
MSVQLVAENLVNSATRQFQLIPRGLILMALFRSEPDLRGRLQSHFGADLASLAILSRNFEQHEHPDVHLALENYVAQRGRSADLVGVIQQGLFGDVSLSDLLVPENPAIGRVMKQGPVKLVTIPISGDQVLSCIETGVYLVRDGKQRSVILLQVTRGHISEPGIKVEVMTADKAAAERVLTDLRTTMRQRSVYRGRVLSIAQQDWPRSLQVRFHDLPAIPREHLILPAGLLERIERQVIDFGRHSDKLRAAGRHLRRGILLHGPPGTGKTLTAMYLVSALKDRTVLLLTARGLGTIERACAVARALQPSVMVLEDIDLIAEERTRPGATCSTPLLFELLNEMDGLSDDMDVMFLLTTNRPDILEPALAARPGRIDQAFEIPLPDAYCRRRLFELYSRGLRLNVADLNPFIKRTKSAGGAFIRELMRKAALFAASDGSEIVVEESHVEEALHELVIHGQEVTKSLLGFRSGSAPSD